MFRRKMVVAGAAVALGVLAPMAMAAADDYVDQSIPTVPPSVEGTILTRTPKPQVLGENQSRGASLPVTGGDIAELTFIGLAAVGTGTVLVRRSRRANAPEPA